MLKRRSFLATASVGWIAAPGLLRAKQNNDRPNILLKAAFPVNILAPTATYEIQWQVVGHPYLHLFSGLSTANRADTVLSIEEAL